MPSIADCLRKSKLPSGVKNYLRQQARDGTAKQAVSDYLAIVEGNIASLAEARKATTTPTQEPARAQTIPSTKKEVRPEEGRADIRREGQVAQGAQPTGQEPEAQVTQPDEGRRTTSARKADSARERELMGLGGLDSPERRSNQQDMDDAITQGIPERAQRLAAEVIAKPRAYTPVESAGLIRAKMTLLNEHEDLMARIHDSTDDADISALSTEVNRVEQEFDILTEALKRSGTERSRALNSQKLTIDQDFRLISVLNRAKSAKGKSLTATQRGTFEKIIAQLEAQNAALQSKLRVQNEARAGKGVRRNRTPGNRFAQQDKLNALYTKAGRLLRAGCHNN